ncbi:hypothetical protein [Methylocystis rosea]|uniref:Uncharacterized protein n=1 Tax=Methylocystis rosea TaxID=173366 RepID=A0A3G8MA21_9HYPH|nr:hypothetical protein [Methylocystis rosea]AZG77628.1 hypothetical protein EHO51_13300 [Methylocystis rosea]
MSYKRQLLAVLAVALAASSARAEGPTWWKAPLSENPGPKRAVDGVNGKLEGFGGGSDWVGFARLNNASAGGMGSIIAPVGDRFGLQVDAIAAAHRGFFVSGGAGHAFWRDPSVGLIGGYGAIAHDKRLDDTRFRVGAESAYYYGPFSLTSIAGYEESSGHFFTPLGYGPGYLAYQWQPRRGRFFDMFDISVYPTYNVKISVGHRYVGGRHAAALSGEALIWNLGHSAITGFIESRVGENDYKAVWGGIRIYLGESDKTLISRHREDDLPNWLKDDMFASQNSVRVGATPVFFPTLQQP